MVVAEILHETLRDLTFGLEGATALRIVRIAGSDIQQLISDLFDGTYIPDVGFQITRQERHPQYNWLRAATIKFGPLETSIGDATYEYDVVEATITYKGRNIGITLPDDPVPLTGTYLEHRQSSSVEIMTIPGHAIAWANGDEIHEDVDAGIPMAMIAHEFVWHNVKIPPWGAMRGLLGKVNSDAVWGAEVAHLLFSGYSWSVSFDLSGDVRYTLTAMFTERIRRSWQELLKPNAGAAAITWSETDPKLYEEAAFAGLFQ